MRAERSEMIIVGAGLTGPAAAWALAARDREVTVLEAFEPGHRRGSSRGAQFHFVAHRSWRADVVIVAAGAWLEPLLAPVLAAPPGRRPEPFPVFIYHDDLPVYGLPVHVYPN